MTFSFSSLVRLLVLMAVGTTMIAVGLARLDPPRPSSRTAQSVKYTNINEYFLNPVGDRLPLWLEVDSGRVISPPLEDGDVLEMASCSPWVDEKNQSQIVGRWLSRTQEGPSSMSRDFGIARYTFPSGKLLDHVSTENVPVGPPCWFPGLRARIIYAAGDGALYHYAFEPEPWEALDDSRSGRDLKPLAIEWRCPLPGRGVIFLSDLAWPEDPRLGGCLVVSVREHIIRSPGSRRQTSSGLWWLKLNFAGSEVVDAGRILIHDESSATEFVYDYRTPVVGSLPDGRLALTYLRQQSHEEGWELRLTPIELDPERHLPTALDSKSVTLATKCQPNVPSFSRDGRWLNVIVGHDAKDSGLRRVPIAGLFGSEPTAPASPTR